MLSIKPRNVFFINTQKASKPKHNFSSSSATTNSSLSSIIEPPQSLFPSKGEFFGHTAALAIASSIASPATSSPPTSSPPRNPSAIVTWTPPILYLILVSLVQLMGNVIKVPEPDIWNDLDGEELMLSVGPDNGTHLHTKRRVTEAIVKLLETRTNSRGIWEFKCPHSLAEYYKPFICHIRQWLIGCAMLFWKLRQKRYLSARAEELYLQVCDMLEENGLRSKIIIGGGESWVFASWFLDHLLLPGERKDPQLWKKVEELEQEDS